MNNFSSSFSDSVSAVRVLKALQEDGLSGSLYQLDLELNSSSFGPLLKELYLRLNGFPSPRILIDAIWLSNNYGGITRVWKQLFNTFSLRGLFSESSPISLINCSNPYFHSFPFEILNKKYYDPRVWLREGEKAFVTRLEQAFEDLNNVNTL